MIREAIFILAVIIAMFALTAIRYRKQLAAGIRIWRMLRAAHTSRNIGLGQRDGSPEKHARGPLVRCSTCGTWVPEERAIKLGTATFYCSPDCVEIAATAP
jgi:hypothetical protein